MKTRNLSIKELAAFIGVSTDTIRRAVRMGEMPFTHAGTVGGIKRGRESSLRLEQRTASDTYLT